MATRTAPAKKAAKTKVAKPTPPYAIVSRTIQGRKVHWYQVEGQNQKGRSVTTILGNGLPAPGLKTWGENTVANCAIDERDTWEKLDRDTAYEFLRKAPDRDRDAAGARGTEVHQLAEKLTDGEEVDVPEELTGHVDAYLDFLREFEPEIVGTELVGANWKYRYFGKFDLLVKIKGWDMTDPERVGLGLLDIKTARSGVFEKDALQLVAYGHFDQIDHPDEKGNCWEPEPMPAVDFYGVLHLSGERVYQLVVVKPDVVPRLFAQFIHCARTAEFLGSGWKKEDKGWSAEIYEPALVEPVEKF